MRLATLPLALSSYAHAQPVSPLVSPLAPLSASITVDARQVLGPVNRKIFGHNIEAANGKGIFGKTDSLASMRAGDGFWNPDANAPVAQAVAFTRDVGASVLRYPGGCLAHGFNWKETIGPLAGRPNWSFGVDEYLKLCAATNSEPLMNVADYTGTPQDAADLVEYLNAPATQKYPWAMKRAANGRREPWGVRYFEMGNESDHGNHDLLPSQKWTAAQYSTWFNECSQKMRAVDPTIQMGALMGTGTGPGDLWNDRVLVDTKGRADFIIVHTYAASIWAPAAPVGGFDAPAQDIPTPDLAMRATMASGEQVGAMLGLYRQKIKKVTGRDVPLAITEYNVGMVQETPQPYRFAWGPALFSSDFQRILMEPSSNVLMANYWHLLNGYWGAIQGPRLPQNAQTWKRYPAYFAFRLWAQHFGDDLISTQVSSPRAPFEGMRSVRPTSGDRYVPETIGTQNLLAGQNPLPADVKDPALSLQVLEDGGEKVWRVNAKDFTGEKYVSLLKVRPAKPGQSFVLRFEARSGGDWKGSRLGLSLVDARGWEATKSGVAVQGAESAREWTPFEARFLAQPTSPGADVVWRILGAKEPASGTFEVRRVRVLPLTLEQFPAYHLLTATASRSKNGKKMYVLVWNKDATRPISTTVRLAGFAGKNARRWVVTGPSLASDNRAGEEVRETESGVATPVANGALNWTFPARSMTAIEVE